MRGRKLGGLGDRSNRQADVRATLNDALELMPPRSRIAMLHQLLSQAVCAMIENEASELAMRMPSQVARPWLPVAPRVSKRDMLVKLVTERPGITTNDAAKTLDMQRSSCGSTLSMLGNDGLVQNRGGGWYPTERPTEMADVMADRKRQRRP